MTNTAELTIRMPSRTAAPASKAYAALVGTASLVIMLQALWAGLFIREGHDYNDRLVFWHARGAELAILLAAAATVVAFTRLRRHRALVLGAGTLTVLLVAEAYLGGLIGDRPGWTAIHMPLGMALMGLSVWLPMRARVQLRSRG